MTLALPMNAPTAFPDQKPVPPYKHTPLFPLGADTTPYKKITAEGVRVEKVLGKDMLVVSREALRALSEAAFGDINHYLRPGHLKQLRSILDDKEASDNDKFVAFDFLKNANIAAGGVLPMCQDTGTAIIMGKKGSRVLTDGEDEAALSEGARDAYLRRNLRYSQVAPLTMYEEKNTANNMPAQCEIYAEGGSLDSDLAYKFMFMAKGGGSANKSFLFQATPSVLTKDRLLAFLKEKVLTLGTAACPPYHLAIVIGGTSAELCMKTVKLASARYLDALPTHGSADGNAFRDLEMEQEILKMTQSLGVGAQFGGKYFCHDVRVIRLPRHGASLPIGLGVSCSADRQVLGKIAAVRLPSTICSLEISMWCRIIFSPTKRTSMPASSNCWPPAAASGSRITRGSRPSRRPCPASTPIPGWRWRRLPARPRRPPKKYRRRSGRDSSRAICGRASLRWKPIRSPARRRTCAS